jgi:protein-disulfide isomerase
MTQSFKRLFLLSAFAAFSGLLIPAGASAADAGFNAAQKEEIRGVMKEYLQQNPELVYEALMNYQQKKQEEMTKAAEVAVTEKKEDLTHKDLPSAGNPDGDVVITEFYDYNCGYCKKAFDDVQKTLEADKNVRVVFKELPILGPTSEVAARWSMAAHKQGKFFAFHSAMMTHTGQIDEAALEKAAKDAGLDVAKMKTDVDSEDVKAEVAKSRELAQALQIQGTPAFVINGKLYKGYLGPEGMKGAIEEARAPKN